MRLKNILIIKINIWKENEHNLIMVKVIIKTV